MNILSIHTHIVSCKMQFLPNISPPGTQIWKIPRKKGGHFRGTFWVPQLYAILKMQFLPHISLPSSQIWKISREKELIFRAISWVHTALYYLEKMQFLCHTSLLSSWIWKNPNKSWSFFQDNHFDSLKPYIILKNAVFTPYLLSM